MTRLLIISAILHVLVLVLVPLIPGIRQPYDFEPQAYAVELVELPREAPAEEATVEPPPPEPPRVEEPEPEESIPETPTPKPKRTKPKLPPSKPEKSLEEKIAERLNQQERTRPPEEPKTTPAPTAPATTTTIKASQVTPSWYLSVIHGKVSSNWDQPSARLVTEERLTVVVSFRIRQDGSVSGITVRRSSGRSTVDQSATKAVRDSTPFPPLGGVIPGDHLDVTIDFIMTRE
jgi:protein TonB